MSNPYNDFVSNLPAFTEVKDKRKIEYAVADVVRGNTQALQSYGLVLSEGDLSRAAFEIGLIDDESVDIDPNQRVIASAYLLFNPEALETPGEETPEPAAQVEAEEGEDTVDSEEDN